VVAIIKDCPAAMLTIPALLKQVYLFSNGKRIKYFIEVKRNKIKRRIPIRLARRLAHAFHADPLRIDLHPLVLQHINAYEMLMKERKKERYNNKIEYQSTKPFRQK
jgi:hypothetical protein